MDWIDGYLSFTAGANSPEEFRLWSAISAIGGAMEKRIFCSTAQGPIYANLFVLLVAHPGVGKSEAIRTVKKFWLEAKKLHLSPDSVTQASIIDSLREAERKILTPTNDLLDYHYLNVAADELGVFVPAYDTDFLSKLTKLYDDTSTFREQRRHFNGGKEMQITNPMINILAGSQPGFLSTLLPEFAWSQGFMSRFFMVFSDTKAKIDLFTKREVDWAIGRVLQERMNNWMDLIGEFKWEPEVGPIIQKWLDMGLEPVPEHSRLAHYNSRRIVTTLKLTMIAALSRSDELIIRVEDFERGREWLLAAEKKMPDVFRSMEGKSDTVVLDDLHYFLWGLYAKAKKPIHSAMIIHFLSTRTTSDKVLKMVELAEKSGRISRQAGSDLYIPRPKNDHGME